MDYRKDYILRMIEMIGELITLILGLIKKGNILEAAKSMNDAYHTFLKQDAAFFRQIPEDKLNDELLQKHNYTNNHLEVLSELLYADAELHYAQGKIKESLELYQKSLHLFLFVEKEKKAFSLEKQSRIDAIKERIEEIKDGNKS